MPKLDQMLRYVIVGLLLLCVTTFIGYKTREAHQLIFMITIIGMFGILLRNIWATLFLMWTCFLFMFFRFQIGHLYVQNIFLGCVLYYLTKLAFKKEHINFFITGVLWVLFLNILYMIPQTLGFDFIYRNAFGVVNTKLMGFMSNTGVTGAFVVMCIPLLMTRGKWGFYTSLALCPLVFLIRGRINIIACAVVIAFMLFFKMKRRHWYILAVSTLTAICLFVAFYAHTKSSDETWLGKYDERFNMWKLVLQDCVMHPVTGWGLDSFRNPTEQKKHLFAIRPRDNNDGTVSVSYWDNPHNLYVSLWYEWGIIGLILLIGYWRQLALWFYYSVKSPNCLALAGFILAFFFISLAHFPAFLARTMVIIIPCLALFEIETK